MIKLIKNNLLWRDGKYIALTIFILSIFSFIFFKPFLIPIFCLFIFSFYFFRNPDRVCLRAIHDKSILICPADGKVVEILQDGDYEGYSQKVSIFLSPLDVHVNWIPDQGQIQEIVYRPGKFIVAFAPKSSDINERNDVIIKNKDNKVILVRQIAGFVARRICCWVKTADYVQAGQKFGMIRFGSRVDILVPSNVKLAVEVGNRVKGGETILGRWI